jgi:IS5 family transposase
MRQTKKGNQWRFGMKVHVGSDSSPGIVHGVVVTPANVHDKHPLPDLLRGGEKRVYGDRGYQGCGEIIKAAAPGPRTLLETAPGVSVGHVREVTEAELAVSERVCTIEL